MPADKSQLRKGYAVRVGLEAFVWSEAAPARNAVDAGASINGRGGRDWGADESGASSSGQNRRRGGKMHSTAVRADVKRLLGQS